MGHSQSDKAASRDRVLGIAARRIRSEGVSSPGIADLMNEAGLTHGGFYKHFASRDALISEAADRALAEGSALMERAAVESPHGPRAGLIDGYLTEKHRDSPATGCALVTLGAAAGRGEQRFKGAYERQVRHYLNLLTGPGEDSGDARAEAVLTLSAMVGAVLMSRAVADPRLSEELLATVAQQLKRRPDGQPSPTASQT